MNIRRDIAVFVAAVVVLAAFPFSDAHAQSASLYFSPSSTTKTAGQSFSVAVRVNTDGQAINAAQGSIVFDPSKIEVTSISKSGSIFNLWTEDPAYSNPDGTIDFEGGVPNPGYTGSSGLIITVNFKTKSPGSTKTNIVSGAILANDGLGTNILASLGTMNVTIQGSSQPTETSTPAPTATPVSTPKSNGSVIQSSTHPDQNKWYSNNSPAFTWELPSDATGVSYIVTEKVSSNPGPNSDGLKNTVSFNGIADGTHYFHLKFKENGTWSEINHFQFNVDTAAPHEFQVQLASGSGSINPAIVFQTTDDLSGIDHYEVQIEGKDWVTVSNDKAGQPYQLSFDRIGTKVVSVKAIDKAGNSRTESSEVTISGLAISSSITVWFKNLFNTFVNYFSNYGLWIAFWVALTGFLILLYRTLSKVFVRVWRKRNNSRSIRKTERKVDTTYEQILTDMKDEIKFLESIGRRRALGPEEKYLKAKLQQYAKSLNHKGRGKE